MVLAHAKIKTTKMSSEGLTGNFAKVCTSENFPLYGIYQFSSVLYDCLLTVGKGLYH